MYPSLEDMQVGRTLEAQNRVEQGAIASAPMYPSHPPGHNPTPYPAVCCTRFVRCSLVN